MLLMILTEFLPDPYAFSFVVGAARIINVSLLAKVSFNARASAQAT